MSEKSKQLKWPADVRFDRGRHWRARIGFVVLAMEQTIEEDMLRLAPPGVGVHFSRVAMENAVNAKTLGAVGENLASAASLILPDENLDVICYACTSGGIVLGEDRVAAELKKGAPNAKATSLISGVIHALNAFKAGRIVVGSPYVDELNRMEKKYLEDRGFQVLDIRGLGLSNDSDMVKVAPDFIKEFAVSIDHPKAEAIFISCGALRSLDVVDEIEKMVQKPVIVSNQAMIWETLRLAGIPDRLDGYGRLLREF
ncbi:Arylmalonate decarboxylase [Candidatus Desulfarcum epimagneticum]|uniref:Arylmalonate decarboxylase n=1 Tax=uncultured Desulfobacteraceae bacterium TaxID=218296 RepID=A0A484HPJ2_9BACT|nr:Arylmalonate decarboxylase [uncultured Desulfobacteraceae bacterium]